MYEMWNEWDQSIEEYRDEQSEVCQQCDDYQHGTCSGCEFQKGFGKDD